LTNSKSLNGTGKHPTPTPSERPGSDEDRAHLTELRHRSADALRALRDTDAEDWDETTRPIEVPPLPPARARLPSLTDGAEERAATFLERVLGTVPPAWRFPSLVVILGFALAVFYLWKTLP
jgi:hypothetical protein